MVAAHGIAGQKDMGLEPFAELFATKGLAVLLFDYRNFGGSEGEPRNWVSPKRHLQDWDAALDYVRVRFASPFSEDVSPAASVRPDGKSGDPVHLLPWKMCLQLQV